MAQVITREPLHLKYRPTTLQTLVGQAAVVTRLTSMVKSKGLPNALLFAGPSGCGKTTTARILARTINCKTLTACGTCPSCKAMDRNSHPDYIEINGANERGIDDMRALIQKSKMNPTLGNIRFIMLDEAQMLTPQSQQTILKPLEEPSPRTCFLIGSMEPQKLHQAIVNRCQTVTLNLLDRDTLVQHIAHVAGEEGHKFDAEINELIADLSGGHVRAALQGLETVIQYVTGLGKVKGDVTEMIKKNVVSAALIDTDDQQAVKVLTAMAVGNQKQLHLALLDTQNHIGLAQKMMFQLQYCFAQLFGVQKHSTVWHTPINKTCWASIADAVADRADKQSWDKGTTSMYMRHMLLQLLEATLACRSELQNFIVPDVLTSISHYERTAFALKVWNGEVS